MDSVSFTVASDHLEGPLRQSNAQQISAIVYRALAFAEAKAPSSARGGFVGVHQDLDALQVVGTLLEEARQDVLIIDPYMDSKVFTDFGPTAPAGVSVRLLYSTATTPGSRLCVPRCSDGYSNSAPPTYRGASLDTPRIA